MRLATIKLHGAEIAGIVTRKGILPVAALNAYKGTGWKEDMMSLIQANHIPGLTKWYNEGGKEELETIPGVGDKRRRALLTHFKSVEALREASLEKIAAVPGMNRPAAENVWNFLHPGD